MMKKLIVANWKSNKTLAEAQHWIESVKIAGQYEIVLCPPFPFLPPLAWMIKQKKLPIILGVQNLSPYPAGEYTGEVTTRNLFDLGIKYAILGHSERRRHFQESNNDVARKVTLSIEAGIIPIVCVDKPYVLSQANAIEPAERERCVVAFEPLSSIGSGEVDSIEDVTFIAKEIRSAFTKKTRILYGGSVDSHTTGLFLQAPEISGVLVGGASLDASMFSAMTQAA